MGVPVPRPIANPELAALELYARGIRDTREAATRFVREEPLRAQHVLWVLRRQNTSGGELSHPDDVALPEFWGPMG